MTGFARLYDRAKYQRQLWTPDMLDPGSLKLWLDPSYRQSLTFDTGISGITSRSQNALAYTQATTVNQPTLVSGGTILNGLPSAKFALTNTKILSVSAATSDLYAYPQTIFIAFNLSTLSGSSYNTLLDSYSDSVGSTAGYAVIIKSNGKSAVFATSTGGQISYDGTGTKTYAVNTNYVMAIEIANNLITTYRGDVLDWQISSTFTLRTNIGATTPYVSWGSSQRFSRYNDQYMGETLIVAGVSPVMRQKVTAFLSHKWGAVYDLSAYSPYKNRPPLKGD